MVATHCRWRRHPRRTKALPAPALTPAAVSLPLAALHKLSLAQTTAQKHSTRRLSRQLLLLFSTALFLSLPQLCSQLSLQFPRCYSPAALSISFADEAVATLCYTAFRAFHHLSGLPRPFAAFLRPFAAFYRGTDVPTAGCSTSSACGAHRTARRGGRRCSTTPTTEPRCFRSNSPNRIRADVSRC